MSLTKIAINTIWLKNRAIVGGIGAVTGGALGYAYKENGKGALAGAVAGAPLALGISSFTRGKRIENLLSKRAPIKKRFLEMSSKAKKIEETPWWKRSPRYWLGAEPLKRKARMARKEIENIHDQVRYIKNKALF